MNIQTKQTKSQATSVRHLVNVYRHLTEIPVVIIFSACHFSKYLPFTFVLIAKDFDLPSSGGYLMTNLK